MDESMTYTCEVCGYDSRDKLTYKERMEREHMNRRMEMQALHDKIKSMEVILINLHKMVIK